jgi:hypothetical protein
MAQTVQDELWFGWQSFFGAGQFSESRDAICEAGSIAVGGQEIIPQFVEDGDV